MSQSNVNRQHLDEYQAGRTSHCIGLDLDSCPHPSGREVSAGMNGRRIAWMNGWLDAKYDAKFPGLFTT